MAQTSNTRSTPSTRSRLAATGLLTALLAACGGGGGGTTSAGVGSGGTGSFTVGTISGFGSVIINGVRYDDSTASIRTDDDDTLDDDKGGALTPATLKLGMVAEVEGGRVTAPAAGQTLSTGTAQVIRYVNEIKGPVTLGSFDPTTQAGTFTVLAQTIAVDRSTVYENVVDLSAANSSNCAYAEVYGFFNKATTQYNATRVECKSSAQMPGSYRLFGVVSAVTTGQISINGLTVNYASLAGAPTALAVNDRVRVRLLPAHLSGTTVTLSGTDRLRRAELRQAAQAAQAEARLEGLVSNFSTTAQFTVNGVSVVTTSSTVFESMALANGTRVEVEGTLNGGVLTARKVSIETEDELANEGVELIGTVSGLAGTTFTLTPSGRSGFTVTFPDVTPDVSKGALSNGDTVEVRGALSANGSTLTATRVKVEIDR